MEREYTTSVSHIKLHFKVVNNPFVKTQCYCTKPKVPHQNFCVIRNKYTYQIFRETGAIGCSKVPNFKKIRKSIKRFRKLFNLAKNQIKDVKVSNITLKGQISNLDEPINLKQLLQHTHIFYLKERVICYYCNLRFPGLYICPPNKVGLITIFSSGKFSIVGIQCLTQEQPLITLLSAIMESFFSMKKKEPLSAVSADT